MIFYFSGSGNSKWVAEKTAIKLSDITVNIADADNADKIFTVSQDERVGFVFPVYAWGPPKIVIEFVRSLKLVNPHYIYFICTCGDETGYAPSIFNKVIKSRSWKCDAGFSVMMPNTYVALPGFDVDDEAIEKNKVMCAEARIDYICEKLKKNVSMKHFECHIGSFPLLKSGIVNPLFSKFALTAQPFKVDADVCIGCAKCVNACPVSNIKLVDKKPVWADNCTQCFACYHSCPVHTIKYGNNTGNKGQYKGKYLD